MQIDPSVNAQPFSALVAPIAEYTWEVEALLGNDEDESTRVPIQFNRPVELIGMLPSLTEVSQTVGLRTPTLADVKVSVDINQQVRITQKLETTTQSDPDSAFVTMLAMSTQFRLLRLQLKNASPDVGLKFRWKVLPDPGPTPIFNPVLCNIAFFVRYLDTDPV